LPDVTAQNDPGPAQAAWRELLDVLRAADRSFLDPARASLDPREVADGYRNLASITAFAFGMYMRVDRDWPVFLASPKDPPGEKRLGEHPDVDYRWAAIRGDRRYRITGHRGDAAYLSFTAHRGRRGSGFDQAFDGHLNHHDLRTDATGCFEIMVAPEPPTEPGVDWLRTSPDVNEIYGRAYHLDPAGDRSAEYRIEPLDPVGPGGADGEEVAARLRQMAEVVRDVTAAMPQPLGDPNVMGDLWRPDPDGPSRMWSALDNVYSRGAFRLEPHQALLVEGVVVPCDYWGIQLWSPLLGSGDARRHRVSINSAQARLGPDGEFRVAITTDDPVIPGLDHVSTGGGRQGTFFVRWMCPGEMPPAPTCRLLDLGDLAHLAP
jgi:hypothetical protein